MAPLPKRRHSTRRGGKRTAAIKLSLPAQSICGACGAIIKPHNICTVCGAYSGKKIITKKVKVAKKA